MGKQSRRHRDERLRRAKAMGMGPEGLAKMALQDAQHDAIRAGGTPCVICAEPGCQPRTWFPPTIELSRYLGAPEGMRRSVTYALCDRCAVGPDAEREGRTWVLRRRQWELALADIGLKPEDIDIDDDDYVSGLEGEEQLLALQEAFERNAPPAA